MGFRCCRRGGSGYDFVIFKLWLVLKIIVIYIGWPSLNLPYINDPSTVYRITILP